MIVGLGIKKGALEVPLLVYLLFVSLKYSSAEITSLTKRERGFNFPSLFLFERPFFLEFPPVAFVAMLYKFMVLPEHGYLLSVFHIFIFLVRKVYKYRHIFVFLYHDRHKKDKVTHYTNR